MTEYASASRTPRFTANGFVIGMVAVSGVCSMVSPAEAAAIGLVAGIMVPFSVELLDALGVDDPSGSISVHAVGGLWGVIATRTPFITGASKAMAQMAMLAALLRICSAADLRTQSAIEPDLSATDNEGWRAVQGLDMCELGGGAIRNLLR